MELKKKLKVLQISLVVCGCLFVVYPAFSFVWPVEAPVERLSTLKKINEEGSKISNVKSQIERFHQKINSIGSAIATVQKFAADVNKYITDAVTTFETIKMTVDTAIDFVNEVQDTLNELEDLVIKTADNTVEEVEEQIENNATEEDVQEIIEEAKNECDEKKKEVDDQLSAAAKSIADTLDDAENQLNNLVKQVEEREDLSDEEKVGYREEAEKIAQNIIDFKVEATSVIADLQNNLDQQYSQYVADAFSAYSQAVSDYYSGKIDKDGLLAAGQTFKDSVASLDISIDSEKVEELVKSAENLVQDVEALQENILNSLSNNKEYNESYSKVVKTSIYAFMYHQQRNYVNAKIVSAGNIIPKGGKSFLLSKELQCKNSFKVGDLIDTNDAASTFKDCVIRAKTDKEYNCGNNKNCDPFSESLYKKYKKDGVYKHIVTDYSKANIALISQLKQFVSGWLVGKKSTFSKLQKKFKSIDNTRNAYNIMGVISIENPKLWGMIRSVDAISRSHNVVQTYSDWGQLYLDGRDEEFSQAMSKKPGVVKDTDTNKEKEIFPHVMLYVCGLTADQVSVKPSEKFDTDKTGAAEQNLAKCLYAYAHGASTGGDSTENKNEAQLMWRERQTKALSEALFQSLLMATKNNYKSTQEYNSKDDNNIVSLTKGLKNTSTSRDDYAALAKIVNYSTQQMLEVVDADALNLQTEIIKDLQTFDEGYFGSIGEN